MFFTRHASSYGFSLAIGGFFLCFAEIFTLFAVKLWKKISSMVFELRLSINTSYSNKPAIKPLPKQLVLSMASIRTWWRNLRVSEAYVLSRSLPKRMRILNIMTKIELHMQIIPPSSSDLRYRYTPLARLSRLAKRGLFKAQICFSCCTGVRKSSQKNYTIGIFETYAI